jgi:hypothetical protein
MRIAVVTAAMGQHDALRDPAHVAPGVRYLCASDHELDSAVWRRVERTAHGNPTRAAREFKILLPGVPEHDYSVWIDARFTLEVDPAIFAPLLMRHDVLAMLHPRCKSIEDEAREIAARGLVSAEVLAKQVESYADCGEPHCSTGLLVRRNCTRVRLACQTWMEQLRKWDHSRDQMSFGAAMERSGVSVGTLQGTYLDNPYATWGRDG